jgi:hypothetical protein
MNSFKKKIQKTAVIASTLLFLNQNLLSESIIKENKINPQSKNSNNHLLGEYELEDTKIYISNSFVRLIYNCEYFKFGDICSHYNINFKENTKIPNHKVFELEIKDNKYLGILLLFDVGQYGFYLFNEKRDKNIFVTLEMFEKNFLENKNITSEVRKKDNLFIVTLNVGEEFTKDYVFDLKNFKSKSLNID